MREHLWMLSFLLHITVAFSQGNALPMHDNARLSALPNDVARINDLIDSAYDSNRETLRPVFISVAQATAINAKKRRELATVYNWYGHDAADNGRFETAELFYRKALHLRDSLRLKEVAGCYNNLGRLLKKQGRYEDAIGWYRKGLAVSKDFGLSSEVLDLWNNLGTSFRYVGEPDSALHAFLESLSGALALNKPHHADLARFNIGGLLQEQYGDYVAARDTLMRCLEGFRRQQKREYEAKCYILLGNNYAYRSALDSAYFYYSRAQTMASYLPDLTERSILLKNQGEILLTQGRSKQAVSFFERSLDTFQQLNNVVETANARWGISRCQHAQMIGENQTLKGWLGGGAMLLLSIGLISYFILREQKQKRALAEKEIQIAHQRAALAEQKAQVAQREKLDTLKNWELEMAYARLEGQDEMQRKIGVELHDSVGAMLSTVKINLPPDEMLDIVDSPRLFNFGKVNRLLDEACEEIRRISHELSSSVLTKFGLRAQLEALADAVGKSGRLEVELVTHGLTDRMDNKTELNIYRIIQELVNNVIKHAKANNLSMQVGRFEHKIGMILEDDGVGFDLEAVRQRKSAGLHNLYARVHDLAGEINIDSLAGRGTIVTIDIPYIRLS